MKNLSLIEQYTLPVLRQFEYCCDVNSETQEEIKKNGSIKIMSMDMNISGLKICEDSARFYRVIDYLKSLGINFCLTQYFDRNLEDGFDGDPDDPDKEQLGEIKGESVATIKTKIRVLINALTTEEETKNEQAVPQPTAAPLPKIYDKPFTFVEAGIGYFKFYKQGEKIKIGREKTRHFQFIQSLCIPALGTQKTIDEVFEAIKNKKDLKNSVLTGLDSPQKKSRMVTTIKHSCIKELQKNKKLKKVSYHFTNDEKRTWLELEE